MPVIDEIAAERRRQIEAEKWDAAHDDLHTRGELAKAAACYALVAGGFKPDFIRDANLWPWFSGWWKPKNPRRDLIRAGALIVAEIERLDRAAANS